MCVVYLVISNRCRVYKLYSFNAASTDDMVKAHVKRKCKTRSEIVGAGSPRP